MASPVVVDGRLTREKLDELRAHGAEHPELDFKATLNLGDAAQRLGLVKDIIAMANGGTGGYIIIGAHDDGRLAVDQIPIVAKSFDSADLAQHVARHVTTAPVVTSQIHDVDGHSLVLVHVSPTWNRLPCLVSKPGEYQVGKNMKSILREGVLYVREGTRTVAATDAHWPVLLERYRAGIVAETREGLDALVRKVVSGMGDRTGGVALSPLAAEMEESAFAEASEPYFESKEGKRRLRQFLRSIRADAGIKNPDLDARSNALTKLALLAVQAVHADARAAFGAIISTMHELYESSVEGVEADYATVAKASYWLDVMLRVFCIGAAIVRERAWWAVTPLVDRRGSSYFPVWLRHGLVHASRADLLSGAGREAAQLLVRARELGIQHPALTADIRPLPALDESDRVPDADPLLDSLCQFDFIWCVVAVVKHTDERDSTLFYPSCAALYQHRAQPAITQLATSDETREVLVGGSNDFVWANSLGRVLSVAVSQSHQYGGWWHGAELDARVDAFIKANSSS